MDIASPFSCVKLIINGNDHPKYGGLAPLSKSNDSPFRYTFILEAPTSIIQRRGDDTLTYLNKGMSL